MTSITEILSAFKGRVLEIDCIDMQLIQNKTTNPISFRGNGYLRQTNNDTLQFKLYATESINTNMIADLNVTQSLKSGEIISEDEYYSLAATANDGVTWTAENIIPNCNWFFGHENPIVMGQLGLLSTENPVPNEGYSVRLHFFEEAEIPCRENHHEFSGNGCNFSVQKLDNEFVLEVSSGSALSAHFHDRIQEALRFLLARSVTWRGLLIHNGRRLQLRLASARPRSPNTRLYSPIGRGVRHVHVNDCWRMYCLYLEYVVKETQEGFQNLVPYHLHNACEASANSYDAWAYGLCIAVEGIASLIKVERSLTERTAITVMNKSIVAFVVSHDCFKNFAKRVEGLLGNMLQDRPEDRLRTLVSSGRIDATHLEAWRKLRNSVVHPTERDLKKMTSENIQELLDRVHRVNVLIYHVIFYLIGYKGKFEDYGSLGFPISDYPLAGQARTDE